jgi:hypothetical protein
MTGVTFNNVAGSNVSLNPASTTTYSITGTTGCGSNTLSFTVTIPAIPGDPAVFGSNEWLVYAYRGDNFNAYGGYYTETNLSFSTSNRWNENNNPSLASGYLGCTIPNDNHSYRMKREGFPCGYYQIGIPNHDDNVQLIINGTLVFSQTSYANNTDKPDVWRGYLDEDATIEFTIREQYGQSIGALNFIYLSGPTTNANQKIWTGKTNSNFNVASNWCNEVVPLSTDHLFIPANTSNNLSINTDATVSNVTIYPTATVSIASGINFTIQGNLSNNGTLNAANGQVSFSGSAAQSLTGNGFTTQTLTLDNSNGLAINTNIDELVTISDILTVSSGTLTTNSKIYLACEMGVKTAQIAEVLGTISGNLITEQCYPGRRAFRFITSSVNTSNSIRANWQENATLWDNNPVAGYGTHITGGGPSLIDGTNGFDKSPSGAASMFTFNNTTQEWAGINNTDLNTLSAGIPYRFLLRGSRSTNIQLNSSPTSDTRLRATGTVSKGPITINTLSNVADGYSFVGNPFHAQVDMGVVLGASTNLTNFIYIWDPNLGTRGAYVNINTSTDASSNGSSDANRFLQPYQAIFVQTIADGAATLTFNENNKTVNETQTDIFRLNNSENTFLTIQLFTETAHANNLNSNDGLRIDFNENENNDVDFNDAKKVSNPDENFSILKGEHKLSLENRSFPNDNEIIPLHISNYKTTNYVFKLNPENLTELNTYLNDKFTNEVVLLNPNESNFYNFSIDNANESSSNSERFEIIFENIPLSNEIIENTYFSLFPNPASNQIFINTNGNFETANVSIYNTIGQRVFNINKSFTQNNQIQIDNLNLQKGMYIVKVKTNNNEVYETKLIIE